MTEYCAPQLPYSIPDDLTIPQFILELESDTNEARPLRPAHIPWLIEDVSGRGVCFKELATRTSALANALHARYNVGEDDVVCLFSPNDIDYPVAIWAIHTLGAIVTPANPSYTAKELVHQLTTTKATLLLCHPAFLSTAILAARETRLHNSRVIVIRAGNDSPEVGHETIEGLITWAQAQPVTYQGRRLAKGEARKKLAFLSFSSGTTGAPKAVAISHYGVIANILQMAAHNRLTDTGLAEKRFAPGDVAVAVLPFFHIYGLVVNLHFTLFAGLSVVVVPKFNFLEFLKSIERHKITHLLVVPPQIVLLCKHPATQSYDFRHVKFCMCGAAPLGSDLMKRVTSILPNASIGQGYGLTESCTTIAMIPPNQRLSPMGSAGQILPGIRARVVKADGTLADEGEPGELVVTGPSMALCYYGNEAATKSTFVDGWVHTGDEVIVTNGNVFIVDRIKEIMKVRGYQVAPAELEGHLLLHEAVLDACVVGVPDEYSGEIPLAYVVLQPSALKKVKENSAEEKKLKDVLIKHVADAKVPYKWLAGGVEFIDAIPKNPSGKILRRILRDEAKTRGSVSLPFSTVAKL